MITKHRRIYTDPLTGNRSYVWFKSANNKKENICKLKFLNNSNEWVFNGKLQSDSDNLTIYNDDNNNQLIIDSAHKIINYNDDEFTIDMVDNKRLIIYAHANNNDNNKILVQVEDEFIKFDDNFNDYNINNVKDSLISKLSILKGELWYKSNYGLPLLEKTKIKSIIDVAVLDIINDQQEIKSVISFDSRVNNHNYILNFSLATIYSNELINININR